MIYEIPAPTEYKVMGKRIGFFHNGNYFIGNVCGWGRDTILVEVDILGF